MNGPSEKAIGEGILVLPEEMEGQFSKAEIDRQRYALRRLSASERARHAKLHAEQALHSAAGGKQHLVQAHGAASSRSVETVAAPMLAGVGVKPLTVGRDCTTSDNCYQIYYRSGESNLLYCVAGKGAWTIKSYLPDVRKIRACAQRGRIMYRLGPTGDLYWSTWRGQNDWNKYKFDDLQIYGTARLQDRYQRRPCLTGGSGSTSGASFEGRSWPHFAREVATHA